MKRIIVDTNFLMIPSQFKVDIFSEIKRLMSEDYSIFVLDSSMGELEVLAYGKGRHAIHARVALELVKQKNLKRIHNSTHDYTDDSIVNGVTNTDIVCTQDRELKKRLKEQHEGIGFITLKSKKYLGFE